MARVTFNNKNAFFFQSLKASVEAYFRENNIRKTGNGRLYIKTAVLIPGALAIYILLLTGILPAIAGILLSALLGFILACIGFNVMHDACHGSYSRKAWVNETLGLTLNALGSNAFLWKQKHNVIHHTYTNVDGLDDDIAKSPVIRQCSTQAWKPVHQVQHLYLPLVYGISSLAWVFLTDFIKYLSRKVHKTPLQPMKINDHIIFWLSKALYVAFYILIPILCVGWQGWLVGFLTMHLVLGFTLAIVFQLAHVVEETEFETVAEEDKVIENEWAIHQIKTTANFSPGNKIISWLAGGLNYQIEHHLFPRISHVHYPAISKIVAAKCAEFGLPYHSMPTMLQAVRSHFRLMRALGMRPAVQPVPVPHQR